MFPTGRNLLSHVSLQKEPRASLGQKPALCMSPTWPLRAVSLQRQRGEKRLGDRATADRFRPGPARGASAWTLSGQTC